MEKLKNIANQFKLIGVVNKIEAFGSGHINDTYRLFIENKKEADYVLQKINHNVFPDIVGLSQNFDRIFNHLSSKSDTYFLIKPEKTISGQSWFCSEDGDYWRVFNYIPNSKSIELAQNEKEVFEAGKAYGWFLKSLADLPSPSLNDTIKNFHNLSFRLNQLEDAIQKNAANRLADVKNEIDFYLSRKSNLLDFYTMVGTKEIPIRTVHNDTKINNVLFNCNNEVISVIDLDTTMPGIVHFDFGDALRTIANSAVEDEKDLSKVNFNSSFFEHFAKGYLSETKDLLSKTEIEYLSLAPILMTYIMGIRFMSDYLNGDKYYKTEYPDHNLQRSKVQIKLIESIEAEFSELQTIIHNLNHLP